jgi:Cytochrome C'
MRQLHSALVLMLAVCLASFVVTQSACQQAASAPAAAAATATPGTPVGTIKDIMKGIVDPSSAAIWDAVSTESGPKGDIEKAPKTDEEWSKLEGDALMLAEVANLLKMPGRHAAKPEDGNKKTQPDAPELTPSQIEEKINKDRAAWDKRADALQQTAVKAIAAAKAHDKDAVLNVGEEIDSACESCHKVYWYPDEKIPSVPATGAPASKG